MRRLTAALVLMLMAFAFAAPAGAYPPGTTLDITPSPTPVNTPIVLVARGFVLGETVSFSLAPSTGPVSLAAVVIGTAVADASGTAILNSTAPPTPGTYLGTSTGVSSGRFATDTLIVTSQAPSLTVSNSQPAPGSTVQVVLAGFCPNSPITITLTGPTGTITLPTVTADANGNVSFTIVAPTTSGQYTLTARDTVCADLVASSAINVVVPGPLPPLGSNGTATGLQIALITLLVGASLWGVTSRRRRPAAAAA